MFARFFSIYFLIGSCLPGTNFAELTKFGDLRDHYRLHVHEAAELGERYTLGMFINDHYLNPDKHIQEGHEDRHQHLPFHSISMSLLICAEIDLVPELDFLVPGQKRATDLVGFSADFLATLLRPPIR